MKKTVFVFTMTLVIMSMLHVGYTNAWSLSGHASIKKATLNAYDRGLQHLEKGELSQAIQAWKQYVEVHPLHPKTRTIRAYLTLLVREEAKQDAKQAISQELSLIKGPFDKHTLAIMPFKDTGIKSHFGKAIYAMVISDLANVPNLQIVERIRLQALLSEMELGGAGLVEEGTAVRAGRLLGAGVIVTGTVFEDGQRTPRYQITTSCSRTETGHQIGYQEATGVRNDWFILEKEIVYEILKDLGVSPIPSSVKKIHTKNWEAYVLFANGLDFLDQGMFNEAKKAFQTALTLDVGFDLARDALQKTPSKQLSVSEILSRAKVNRVEHKSRQNFTEAVTKGTPRLNVRYRYEWVDQDSFSKDAHASTIRTRLGYLTGTYFGFQTFIEMEDTHALRDDYNTPVGSPHGPKNPDRPVVSDPEFIEINQFWLDYSLPFDTRIRLGRQKIILDDARFIGNVGWAQNEQTFDGVTLQNKGLSNIRLFYGYLTQVNTIIGDVETHSKMDKHMKSHIINVSMESVENIPLLGHTWLKLAGYGYFIHFDKGIEPETLGIFLEGNSQIISQANLLYHFQYASQKDHIAMMNIDPETEYYRIELGSHFSRFTINAGYEVMTSDNGTWAFQTPLAWGYNNENKYLNMPHRFNGWTHKFEWIPMDGLEDKFVSLEMTLAGIRLRGEYHEFSAERNSTDYGTETDVMAIKQFGKPFTVGLIYADYRADNFSDDTKKALLFGEVSF